MNLHTLLIDLKQDEGFSAKMYRCPAGFLTIGYGHNLEANCISAEAAESILLDDIREALHALPAMIGVWGQINDVRQNVLINMCFNLGPNRFADFKHMIAAVNALDWVAAAKEGRDSKWFSQVGHRAERLMKELETGVRE